MINTNRVFYILVALIGIVVFITVILILKNLGGGDGGPEVKLQFWGVFDDRNAFEKSIRDFEAINRNIKVEYRQVPFENYEKELLNALATGAGPDVLMIHHTWLPKHGDKLAAMPIKIKGQDKPMMTAAQFKNEFVDVAYNDLVFNNAIYGIPLYVDTLALYYNRDMLSAAGITAPPKSWSEFNSQVELMTRLDRSGEILQSGAALGTAYNVNRSTDIVAALMMQSRTQMTDDEGNPTFSKTVQGQPAGETALRYYTDFANPNVKTYSWDAFQHYSIDAFIEGKTAMMLNYSHQAQTIKARASRLNFSVASMPQTSENQPVNYANYWAVAVSSTSVNPDQAWLFTSYLGSKEGISSYLTETGRPAARRDLIEIQKSDPDLGVYALQALTARSWKQPDNIAVETIFGEMIADVNLGRSNIREAIRNAEARIRVLVERQ